MEKSSPLPPPSIGRNAHAPDASSRTMSQVSSPTLFPQTTTTFGRRSPTNSGIHEDAAPRPQPESDLHAVRLADAEASRPRAAVHQDSSGYDDSNRSLQGDIALLARRRKTVIVIVSAVIAIVALVVGGGERIAATV